MPPALKRSSTYAEDIVKLNSAAPTDKDAYAVVTRCWADEQAPEAQAEAQRLGIPFTPLDPGQLEILFPSGTRFEISEDAVTVVDRGFLTGDLVRVTGGKSQAGIITDLATQVQLQRVLSEEVLEGWFDAKDVVAACRITRGDHVVFGDWVGLVEEVFEMAMVETTSGVPRRICDTGNTLSVGATTDNFLQDRVPFPQIAPGELKRVLDVKQIVVAVNWLCMNQLLDSAAQNGQERPKRYWTDIDHLSLVRASADHLHSVGDRVVFRDPTSHPLPPSLRNNPYARGHHVLAVTTSKTLASVLWQDGTSTTLPSPSFEHCVNIDEDVDVFPGDIGVFAGTNRVGVVQSMESKKRTVRLRWYGTEEEEVVSGLEFDPHGPPPEVYGVRRQDWVLISRTGNGVPVPTVPRLGESELLTGGFPSVEGLRAELSVIGIEHASRLGDGPAPLPVSGAALASINWYAEVVQLLLDGRVLVQFPSGRTEPVALDRIYHLDDGMDPEGDGMGDGMDLDGSSEGSGGSWETDGEGEALGPDDAVWDDHELLEEEGEERRGWAEDEEVRMGEEAPQVTEIVLEEEKKVKEDVSLPAEVEEDESWRRFTMLEEAPKDHHYAKEPIQVPTKAYMSRVKKEYNVLASSLPPNILVRAYENRADLLRCLIIGPLGTPFQNAPFLFDVFLSPTKFPQEPPSVFFHSWAGGTRVSPNLYAEGKVCLSLLNTWHGDKSESWSAARSSILQVVISIQSLIMVENPYYTEPGFEKQQTTPEGQTASDLYNERTFVLTRAFVKRACEYPPTDFGAEIRAYYYTGLPTTGPGALKGVVEQSKLLLEESEAFHAADVVGGQQDDNEEERRRPNSNVLPEMKVLTEGAGLSLKRSLVALEGLLPR